MNATQNIIERQREKATREREALALIERVAPMVPGTPANIFAHAYMADFSIKYEVQTRAEAITLAKQFQIVPLCKVSGACTSFIPRDKAPGEEDARATVIADLYPLTWEHNVWGEHEQYRETLISFYAQIGDLRADVDVVIKADPARLRADHLRDARTGRITSYRWSAQAFPHGDVTRFASGSHDAPGKRVVSFPTHDADPFDTNLE